MTVSIANTPTGTSPGGPGGTRKLQQTTTLTATAASVSVPTLTYVSGNSYAPPPPSGGAAAAAAPWPSLAMAITAALCVLAGALGL